MGWTLYPCFFRVVSETARDIEESYAHKHVGTLPEHPLEGRIMPELISLEIASKWGANEFDKF